MKMKDSIRVTLSYTEFLHRIDKHIDQNKKYKEEEEKLFQRFLNFQKIYDKFFPHHYELLKSHQQKTFQELKDLTQTTGEMNQRLQELSDEMICLKLQQKKLLKKLNKHKSVNRSTNTLDTCSKDKSILYSRKIKYHLMKSCTNVYIDDSLFEQHRLGGFVNNIKTNSVHPFEFSTKRLSKDETADKLWQVLENGASHIDDWNEVILGSHQHQAQPERS